MTRIEQIMSPLEGLIEQARKADVAIIFVRNHSDHWTDSEALIEQRKSWATAWPKDKPFKICTPGSWGADFYRVKPTENECIVTKHRYSAFVNTDLDVILRSRGIKTVIMTGVATNVCVESTARHGFMLNYYVVFAEDCCGSCNAALHEATLINIREHFGTVVKAADVIGAWRHA